MKLFDGGGILIFAIIIFGVLVAAERSPKVQDATAKAGLKLERAIAKHVQ